MEVSQEGTCTQLKGQQQAFQFNSIKSEQAYMNSRDTVV